MGEGIQRGVGVWEEWFETVMFSCGDVREGKKWWCVSDAFEKNGDDFAI